MLSRLWKLIPRMGQCCELWAKKVLRETWRENTRVAQEACWWRVGGRKYKKYWCVSRRHGTTSVKVLHFDFHRKTPQKDCSIHTFFTYDKYVYSRKLFSCTVHYLSTGTSVVVHYIIVLVLLKVNLIATYTTSTKNLIPYFWNDYHLSFRRLTN